MRRILLSILVLFALCAGFSGAANATGQSLFWIGGTGNTNDPTHWSLSSGGATCSCTPSGDVVTFNGLSGGGTVTVNADLSITDLTTSAFTGTIDFSANNNNITLTTGGWIDAATGAHTINMGNGIWTFSATSNSNPINITAGANLTLNKNSSTIVLSGNTTTLRTLTLGSHSYNTLTISANTSGGATGITGTNSITTLNVAAPAFVGFPTGGSTTTIGTINPTGTSATALISFATTTPGGTGTIPLTNPVSTAWVSVRDLTFTGSSFSAVSSFNLGHNALNGGTITVPSGGSSLIGL